MPVGTRHCCGILEVSHNSDSDGFDGSVRTDSMNSFSAHALFMGHHHRHVTISQSEQGQVAFLDAVEELGEAMTERPSCLKL